MNSFLAVLANKSRMRWAPGSYLDCELGFPVGDLRYRHRINRLTWDLRKVEAVEQARYGDPDIHFADLPSYADSAT
jgi:hypothetical protein|tara:strand:+ start:16787 stop:17014 length:228 start_codon:yes stop_codon:yes gene_type:complete